MQMRMAVATCLTFSIAFSCPHLFRKTLSTVSRMSAPCTGAGFCSHCMIGVRSASSKLGSGPRDRSSRMMRRSAGGACAIRAEEPEKTVVALPELGSLTHTVSPIVQRLCGFSESSAGCAFAGALAWRWLDAVNCESKREEAWAWLCGCSPPMCWTTAPPLCSRCLVPPIAPPIAPHEPRHTQQMPSILGLEPPLRLSLTTETGMRHPCARKPHVADGYIACP